MMVLIVDFSRAMRRALLTQKRRVWSGYRALVVKVRSVMVKLMVDWAHYETRMVE